MLHTCVRVRVRVIHFYKLMYKELFTLSFFGLLLFNIYILFLFLNNIL